MSVQPATLRLMLGPTPLAEPKTVTVPKGGSVSVQFPGVSLTTAMSGRALGADRRGGAVRDRRDEQFALEHGRGDRARARPLERARQALGGYGAQFNQHVYAPVTNRAAGDSARFRGEGEGARATARAHLLQRQLGGAAAESPENLESFIETVQLAQEAGATINITYQTANVARSAARRVRWRSSRRCSRTSSRPAASRMSAG